MFTNAQPILQESKARNVGRYVDDDEMLLMRMRDHDDYEAFASLFTKYYVYLCEQSFALIHCEQKAEEIVSDLFFKIWKNRSGLTIASKVKPYLRRSARNKTIDHIRKYRREVNFSDVELPEHSSSYPDPEHYTIGEDCRKRIEDAVSRLPPKSRLVFTMSRDEGKKYQEIADELSLSIKTIETHMRRALIFLRKELYSDTHG